MSSQERFGFEWDNYSKILREYEGQFLNWIGPLTPSNFKNKDVLDAGCGMGRNSYWPLKYGAKSVTSFDFDKRSVARAEENLKGYSNSKVFFQSIYDLKDRDVFDITMCIGVLHHLAKPKDALHNFFNATRVGGLVVIWVYSYEGNEWIVKLVNPIRKHITSKLPVSFVHFLSYFCSVPLWVFIKIFKGPSKYLKQLSKFSFKHVHSIVFDQLIPDVANYWKKSEVIQLFQDIGFKKVDVFQPVNGSGWTIIAQK